MELSQLFYNCAYDVEYEEVGHGVNYAFVEEGDTLFIYFQGSSQTMDWIRNFLFRKKPYKDMEIPYYVHRGFLAAWKEVEDIIIAKITEKITAVKELNTAFNFKGVAKTAQEFRWKQIIVVGYSHGGALAGLCHECVWYWRPDLREEGLLGFGFEAPRFYAGFKVKKTLKERWKTFTIIRDNSDIVTHCPPWLFGYCHVSRILKIHGDNSLCPRKWIPCCIKAHYPEVVYDGLIKLNDKQKI